MKGTWLLPLAMLVTACGPATAPVPEKSAETAAAAPARTPATPDDIELPRGFYVEGGIGCAQAVEDKVSLFTRTKLRWLHETCTIEKVEAAGETRFHIVEFCQGDGGGARFESTLDVKGPLEFEKAVDGGSGSVSYRFCPAMELPEPWRSQDIAGALKE